MPSTIEQPLGDLEQRFLDAARGSESEAFRDALREILSHGIECDSEFEERIQPFCSDHLGIEVFDSSYIPFLRETLLRVHEGRRSLDGFISNLLDDGESDDFILEHIRFICAQRSAVYSSLNRDLGDVKEDRRLWVEFAFKNPLKEHQIGTKSISPSLC